jgi:hypothetical protein
LLQSKIYCLDNEYAFSHSDRLLDRDGKFRVEFQLFLRIRIPVLMVKDINFNLFYYLLSDPPPQSPASAQSMTFWMESMG